MTIPGVAPPSSQVSHLPQGRDAKIDETENTPSTRHSSGLTGTGTGHVVGPRRNWCTEVTGSFAKIRRHVLWVDPRPHRSCTTDQPLCPVPSRDYVDYPSPPLTPRLPTLVPRPTDILVTLVDPVRGKSTYLLDSSVHQKCSKGLWVHRSRGTSPVRWSSD